MSSLASYLKESAQVIESAVSSVPENAMNRAVSLCVDALKTGKAILTCGNGGSACDAMHISGELVARFLKDRKAQNCICLSDNVATITAWTNDCDYASVFARQVEAYGTAGGVLIAISTSGNSPNVVNAAQKAKEMGLFVISLTGEGGGKLAPLSDILFAAPSKYTPHIQQVHVCYYHYLCEKIEAQIA